MQLTSISAHRKALVVAAATTALLAAGSTVAVAGGLGANHRSNDGVSARKLGPVNGTMGGVCKAGFDTQQSALTPPDDSRDDNPSAGTVTLKKKCVGPATVTFSSETNTATSGAFIHLDIRATCVGTGGYVHHCAIGAQKLASPNDQFFQTDNNGLEVHSTTQVFANLNRGKWRVEVLPGGDGTAFLDFRSTVVQAYAG